MRRLILFRHAKAEGPDPNDDHGRALMPRGHDAAKAVGEWLAYKGIVPDLVLCSGAIRARQTWSLASRAFDPPPEVVLEDRIYDASAEELLELVRETDSDVATLLLVGHNPGLEMLTSMLAESGEPEVVERFEKKFPTAAIAILDFDDAPWGAIDEKTAWLYDFVTPKSLGVRGE